MANAKKNNIKIDKQKLRNLMKAKSITRKKLSNEINRCVKTIQNIKGTGVTDFNTLHNIARSLDVYPMDLLPKDSTFMDAGYDEFSIPIEYVYEKATEYQRLGGENEKISKMLFKLADDYAETLRKQKYREGLKKA